MSVLRWVLGIPWKRDLWQELRKKTCIAGPKSFAFIKTPHFDWNQMWATVSLDNHRSWDEQQKIRQRDDENVLGMYRMHAVCTSTSLPGQRPCYVSREISKHMNSWVSGSMLFCLWLLKDFKVKNVQLLPNSSDLNVIANLLSVLNREISQVLPYWSLKFKVPYAMGRKIKSDFVNEIGGLHAQKTWKSIHEQRKDCWILVWKNITTPKLRIWFHHKQVNFLLHLQPFESWKSISNDLWCIFFIPASRMRPGHKGCRFKASLLLADPEKYKCKRLCLRDAMRGGRRCQLGPCCMSFDKTWNR